MRSDKQAGAHAAADRGPDGGKRRDPGGNPRNNRLRTPGTDREGSPGDDERFGETIGRKAERKLRARGSSERNVWFWLGMFGLVGWAVAVPAVLGIALGLWLDRRWPVGQVSWTLTFLIIGVAAGCLNAWYWIQRESRHD